MNERIEASAVLEEACRDLGYRLADLIALASIWVAPEVYEILRSSGGVWYPDKRRANLGLRVDGKAIEAVGQVIDGITLDSNSFANTAFKMALGIDRRQFVGFHVCHIWRGTAYDPSCFSQVANLVGIPAELASLTDHHPHIVACLRYRAWELYGWKPEKEAAPVKPTGYPLRWRVPRSINDEARRSAKRRTSRGAERRTPPAVQPSGQPRPEHPRLSGDAMREAAMIAALYLSKFEHHALRFGNQGETFDQLAKRLSVNRSTLKHWTVPSSTRV